MYFQVRIQMHACIIKDFLSCHQDSYFQYDIDPSHQNHIQYFHVLPIKHLLYYFPAVGFHPLIV